MNDPLYIANKEAFEYITSIMNDVYSFNREQMEGGSCNIVFQLLKNNPNIKNDAQKAMNKVSESFFSWVDKWETTSKQMIEKFPEIENMEKYIKCLNYGCVGTLIWSRYSERYVRYNRNIPL